MLNLAAFPLVVLAYNLGGAGLARLLGVKVYEVAIGMGPTIAQRRLGGTDLTLKLFLFGGYVKFATDPDGESRTTPEPPGMHLSELNPLLTSVLFLAGPLAALLVAVLLLGPSEALACFRRGFSQAFQLPLEPFGTGTTLGRTAVRLITTAPFLGCVGVVAAKMAACNLLPLPPLNGFHVVKMLLVGPREPPWLVWAVNVGAIVGFGWAGLAAWALWIGWSSR